MGLNESNRFKHNVSHQLKVRDLKRNEVYFEFDFPPIKKSPQK